MNASLILFIVAVVCFLLGAFSVGFLPFLYIGLIFFALAFVVQGYHK